MINKKAVIGRTMALISTILFVIIIMVLFGIYSASIGSTKSGEDSKPDSKYEVNSNSLFFSTINFSGNNEVILFTAIREYSLGKSDFSDDFKRAIYKFMHSNNNFSGNESCLLLTIGNYANMHKEIVVDPSNDEYSLYLIKDKEDKIKTRYESEHAENIRAIDEKIYFGMAESKITLNGKDIDVFSYYGECQ